MTCPTCDSLGNQYVPPSLPGVATRLLAWGEAPGADEVLSRQGFSGASGRELRSALKAAGLRTWSAWPRDPIMDPALQEVSFSNTVLSRPPGNKFPGREAARVCMASHPVQQELLAERKLPWLACGANAVEALTGFRLPILQARGSLLPVEGQDRWVTATLHPAFLVRGGGSNNPNEEHGKGQSEWKPLLILDCLRALKSSTAPPDVPAVIVGSASELRARFAQDYRPNQPVLIGTDVEGSRQVMRLLQLCWSDDEVMVVPWQEDCVELLTWIFGRPGVMPIFHNGAYDVPELRALGTKIPDLWVDTINLGALLNPGVKLSLESQGLSYVPRTLVWKGLVDHNDLTAPQPLYERLWTEVLTRLGRPVPQSRFGWFCFYGGVDAWITRRLALAQKTQLEAVGRMSYYRNIMQPLQPILLDTGERGMPCDTERRDFHRRACERLERMAQRILDEATAARRGKERADLDEQIATHERERDTERAGGIRKYSKAEELSALRSRIRGLDVEGGFNGDSAPQRTALLYEHLGLPQVHRRRKKKGQVDKATITSDDNAVEGLIARLKRGTVKAKGCEQAEAIRVCKALVAIKKWSLWRRNFLTSKDGL